MNISKIIFFLCLIATNLSAQLNAVADRHNATYEVGESMHFNITSPTTGPATYTIQYDERAPFLSEGTIDLQAGVTAKIPFTGKEPSFVLCKVVQFGTSSTAAATFSPYDLQPFEDEPADFDAFWESMKAELSTIPMDVQIWQHSSTNLSTVYNISLANIEGRRVYGYVSVPNEGDNFPAVLIMPPFGSGPNHVKPENYVTEQLGVITMSIGIHNAPVAQGDPNAYQPNDLSSRETNYYRFAYMGAVRAIDYIFSRPDFDGTNMAVMGVSQGGGLSLCVSGLDNRVKLLVNSISALCQHSGYRYGKAAGHPYFIFKSKVETNDIEHELATGEASKYYDAVYFARRFDGPSLTYMSYEDVTCPPSTVLTANNQLLNTKLIVHRREEGHDSPDFWLGRFSFFRKHFPVTQNAPIGYVPETGYYANAGADQTTSVNTPITLNGIVELDGTSITNLPIRWEKVSGPGRVAFGAAESNTTTASFSEPGTYIIRFFAEDYNYPESEAKWVSIVDYVKVVVE